jgi:hypothetical protein
MGLIMIEPTEEQINGACLSVRRDFGVMYVGEQAAMRYMAREWLKAWANELGASTATPYAWAVTGVNRMYRGEFAQYDATEEARRCGGTARAFPLYLCKS